MVTAVGPMFLRGSMPAVLIAALLCWGADEARAQTPPGVVRAVGPVTEVWTRDDRFAAFHAELAARFTDVPSLDAFMREERWVTVLTSNSYVLPVFVKARVPKEVQAVVGDVVEIRVAEDSAVTSYAATSLVTKRLCARTAPSFAECRKGTDVGMWSADGTRVVPKRAGGQSQSAPTAPSSQ